MRVCPVLYSKECFWRFQQVGSGVALLSSLALIKHFFYVRVTPLSLMTSSPATQPGNRELEPVLV